MDKEMIANDCENLVIEINKLHEECLPGFAMVQSINLLQTYIIKALEVDVPKGVLAIIAVVKDGDEYKLHITDNEELGDDWWRALPEAMAKTVDAAILSRR